MTLMKLTVVTTTLVCVVLASPAVAQEEEWSDDDPVVYEYLMDLDRQVRDLDEQLEGLDEDLAFDFTSNFVWTDDYCDGEKDCHVHVTFNDGIRYVIVNGDTVETRQGMFPHGGRFAHKFGPQVHFNDHALGRDFYPDYTRFFDYHRDAELRRLEREASNIARKARNADGDEQSALETELEQKLNEIFDRKMEHRNKAIQKAEERLSRMKNRRDKRQSARDEIIRNRKDELLGRDKYLEW